MKANGLDLNVRILYCMIANLHVHSADASDFQPLSEILIIPSTLTVGASVCQNITITIIGDILEEGDESFTVTVSATSPNTITPITAATVTILDDGDGMLDNTLELK